MNSPFFRIMEVLVRFVALNVLYLAVCVPLVTIPAATGALFAVARQTVQGREPQVWPTFWYGFRGNWLQSSAVGGLSALVALVLWVDYRIVTVWHVLPIGHLALILFYALMLFAFATELSIFPMMVHMELKTRDVLLNALKLTTRRPGLTVVNLLALGLLFYLCLHVPLLFAGFYFSVSATFTYWIADKKFQQMAPADH